MKFKILVFMVLFALIEYSYPLRLFGHCGDSNVVWKLEEFAGYWIGIKWMPYHIDAEECNFTIPVYVQEHHPNNVPYQEPIPDDGTIQFQLSYLENQWIDPWRTEDDYFHFEVDPWPRLYFPDGDIRLFNTEFHGATFDVAVVFPSPWVYPDTWGGITELLVDDSGRIVQAYMYINIYHDYWGDYFGLELFNANGMHEFGHAVGFWETLAEGYIMKQDPDRYQANPHSNEIIHFRGVYSDDLKYACESSYGPVFISELIADYSSTQGVEITIETSEVGVTISV